MAIRQLTIVKAQISDVVITLRIPAFTTESIKEAPSVPQLDPRTGETRAFPDDPIRSYTPVVLGLHAGAGSFLALAAQNKEDRLVLITADGEYLRARVVLVASEVAELTVQPTRLL
jgi:hypothetical protein